MKTECLVSYFLYIHENLKLNHHPESQFVFKSINLAVSNYWDLPLLVRNHRAFRIPEMLYK